MIRDAAKSALISKYCGWRTPDTNSFCFFLVPILIVIAAIFNLGHPNLWFDESAQFWISRGETPFSSPLQPVGTLWDTIRFNSMFNLDPGGFSLLLRYWEMASTYHVWLRILPFLFFILTVLLFMKLGMIWSGDRWVAALIALVPFFSTNLFAYGFEIRAFSMEYCGTTFVVYSYYFLRKNPSILRVLICGIALSFFASSRYTEIVFVGFGVLLLTFRLWKSRTTLVSFFLKVGLLVLPILVTLSAILLYSFELQVALIKGVRAPTYVSHLSQHNWASIALVSLPIVVFLTLLALLRKNKAALEKLAPFALVLVSGNVLFGILDFLGLHVWDPTVRWCISLNLLDYLAVGASISLVPRVFKQLQRSKSARPGGEGANPEGKAKTTIQSLSIVGWLLPAYLLIAFGIIDGGLPILGAIRYPSAMDSTWPPQVDQTEIDLARIRPSASDRFFVTMRARSTTRYLFEYGALKYSGANYPKAFRFDSGVVNSLSEIPSVGEYDVFISDHWRPFDRALGLKAVKPWGGIVVRDSRLVRD